VPLNLRLWYERTIVNQSAELYKWGVGYMRGVVRSLRNQTNAIEN